jgi:AcrR family transcriptional regulator
MAEPSPNDENYAPADDPLPDGDPASVQRRAPFSTNPRVGVRGLRAQQRILEAALQVFGEVGYHRCGVIRITKVAGCSRAAFYQYFSSKEDVFRHLAGQVARQLTASAEALDAVTPDRAGWETLHDWIGRHADIYRRYEPVFRVFESAAESDDVVASGAARVGDRHVAGFQTKLTTTSLPSRHVARVIALLLAVMTRTRRLTDVHRTVLPPGTLRPDLVDDALTDVVHRTLFGLDPAVNVRPVPNHRPPRARMAGTLLESMQADAAPKELTPAGARTLELLLSTAHDVLVARGYHGTRVDDITAAAEVSHGAFYRYFDNKDHLVRVLAVRALREVSAAFGDIPSIADAPGPAGSAALRQWLRRYNATHASNAAMIRVWVDATAEDPILGLESGAALDWGRRRLVHFLEPRGFGDVESEAMIMVALLDVVGAQRHDPATIEAGALTIERGLLGFGPRAG